MPELPDVELYVAKIQENIMGRALAGISIFTPFLLRTVQPKPLDLVGKEVIGVQRLGKRIVICLSDDLYLVIHLMIAGRLLWKEFTPATRPGGKITLASFRFENGMLLLTEAGSKRRASLMIVRGEQALSELNPGGLDVLKEPFDRFEEAIRQENRTLKRALTNPRWFSGIGNAYSDEILHAARLSPLKLTGSLTSEEVHRLHWASRDVLTTWLDRLKVEFADHFPGPGEVTAFRPDFAVHGKYGKACPVCGKPVQRVVYGDNETNYCAVCQNGGKLLADRALSRLLKDDWPRNLED